MRHNYATLPHDGILYFHYSSDAVILHSFYFPCSRKRKPKLRISRPYRSLTYCWELCSRSSTGINWEENDLLGKKNQWNKQTNKQTLQIKKMKFLSLGLIQRRSIWLLYYFSGFVCLFVCFNIPGSVNIFIDNQEEKISTIIFLPPLRYYSKEWHILEGVRRWSPKIKTEKRDRQS